MKSTSSSSTFVVFSLAISLLAAVQVQGQSYSYAQASAQASAIQGGQSSSFAKAMAVVFTSRDSGYASAMASAMVQGISQYGCNYYKTVITEARAIAISDGKGNVFAQAMASVTVLSGCYTGYGYGGDFGGGSSSQASASASANSSGRKLLAAF